MSRFSVVTPVYNREHLIEPTLASILAQGRDDLDVIVVDDGSTDRTAEVARRFDSRIRVIEQENAGPGAARNRGIEAATGEYIAFLDSDDLWFPWTLDVYEEIIETHHSPSFIAGQPFVFDDEDDVARVERPNIKLNAFPDFYASSDAWRWWSVSSFVMRTDALRRVGGFTERRVNGEDADLTLRMGTEPGFIHVAQGPTFAYREHSGNLMGAFSKNAEGARYKVEQEEQGNYPGGDRRKQERRRILTRHVRPTSLGCLDADLSSLGWWLYRHTFPWNAALGRWRYLAGFPLRALLRSRS